jgi:hypothetical protein
LSGIYISLVLQGMRGVDPSAKLVAIVLADCANPQHNGVAFPSVATIMERTGLAERSVQVHLRELVLEGWIETVGSTRGGRGMATRYRLNVPRLRAEAHKKGAAHDTLSGAINGAVHCGVSSHVKGAADALKGAVCDIKRVQPTAPELEVILNINRTTNGPVPAGALLSLRQALKKRTPEPENVDAECGSAQTDRPNRTEPAEQRTQAEQIEWVRQQLAAKGKP